MKSTFLAALALSFWAVLTLPAAAAKVKVWHHNTPGAYEKAQFKQAVLSNEGAVRLSRQLKPLASIDATHVWDLLEDRHGNLFVATGGEGKIFKVSPDGKAALVYTSDDSQVLCLALAPDGAIHAGTGPAGRIIRLAEGKPQVLYDAVDGYVWSLAFDPKGEAIFAGTGPKGRILRVTPDGKATVFFTSKQDHILCLAFGPDGMLYAGADRNGLVYRIDQKGKGFVLYQAPQAEVRTLVATADGVYFGTSAPTNRKKAGSTTTSAGSGLNTSALSTESGDAASVLTRKVDSKTALLAPTSSPKSEGDNDKKGTPAPAPSTPGTGENSLYRIAKDGTVREVFREKALILSLLRQKDHFFVGTGMEGQLFEIDEASKERQEIARLDHGQVLSLLRRGDGSIVVGAGDPGKLYVLQDRYASQGSLVSEVLDAKIPSKWGSLRWHADTPAGTKITVAVRSGNVSEPDETWSDWSSEQTDADQAVLQAPTARFLQYRVTLTSESGGVTPSLRSIALRYATTNQAPEITKLEVPDLNAVNLDNPKKLKIKWTAQDPNEDELTYNLYVRKDGWKSWVLLEDDLDKPEYEWDTTTTPSGQYQVKVVASDRKENTDDEAQTGERTSPLFAVCHTAPNVTVKVAGVEGNQVVVEALASSPLVRLTSASFAVNGKKWTNVFPSDGLFDSKSETFKFKTESLKPGTYVLVLRVKDASGNTGSSDLVFTVQEPGQK